MGTSHHSREGRRLLADTLIRFAADTEDPEFIATMQSAAELIMPVERVNPELVPVVPVWMAALPLQQQSVLLLAARGPDGAGKLHRCKLLVRVYRGTVFRAARYGRLLSDDELQGEGDTFMDRRPLRQKSAWVAACEQFELSMEELPHHYVLHFMHGVEILGYKHPDPVERSLWLSMYYRMAVAMHVNPETEREMDNRLGDWGRRHWYRDEGDPEDSYDEAR